jgi:2,4-dienoyl-CoA reductase (NADPH2)
MKFQKLFEPIRINRLSVKNRIVMPAVALFYTDNFSFTDRYKAFYRERARGGVGLMFIGPIAIDKVGSSPFLPGLFHDSQIDSFQAFIDELHRTGDTRIGIQFMHQGRYASKKLTGVTPIAPSAISSPINTEEVPREMTIGDIEAVQTVYVEAALRAKAAGFDYIEILMAGGYLVGEFLSPVSNHRTDGYGGTPEKRMRFGLEIIRKVRSALGRDFALGIRVSGQDYVKGGNTIKESSLFCIEAEKAGIDGINVTGGWHETDVPQVSGDVPDGAFLYLSRAIKQHVSVPVFASNRLGNPVLAEKALQAGFADMICWARPLIADPELPVKIRSGRMNEVVPCIGCNQGCLDAIFSGSTVSCTVNPRVGREAAPEAVAAQTPKKIFVAGGGPAGMQFALTAAQRGHDVTLFEKDEKLGGQVNLIGAIPGKEIYVEAVKSLVNRLKGSTVKIELNTLLTKTMILEKAPDMLIVATGAKPATLNLPGIDRPHVIDAWNVLDGSVTEIGRQVVIIGGGATGCETALMVAKMGVPSAEAFSFLAYHSADDLTQLRNLLYDSGREITIIEIAARVAATVGASTRWSLLKNLRLMGVRFRTRAKIVSIEENTVHLETPDATEAIAADTVIMAAGSVPVNTLGGELSSDQTEIFTIGDAKGIGKLSDAVREGFDLGLKV